MKKGEKIMILVLLVILVIAIIAFVGSKKQNKESNNTTENTVVEENNVVEEYVQVLEDGTKLNTSSELSKAKQVGAYKFENMQLTEQNGQTVLLADVTNTACTTTTPFPATSNGSISRCNIIRQKRKRNSKGRRNNLTITTRSKNTI